jgi:hypothetical protein
LAIGQALKIPRSTVMAWLRRLGLNRPPVVAPAVPIQRYEWPRPGDMIHVDIKPLGGIGCVGHRIHGDRRRASRGVGWEYVHVAVDDHSRIAYVEVLGDQLGPTYAAFLTRAVAWFRARRVLRQRQRVRVPRLPGHLRAAPRPPPTDARLYAADQRQSRTIHSDDPAGMGVCDGVRHVGRAPPSAASLPGLLQPPPTHTRASSMSRLGPGFRALRDEQRV